MPPATYEQLIHQEDRLADLRAFLQRLRSVDSDVDSEFHSIFYRGQLLLELPDQVIADALRVSRPTVNRWASGKSLPHRALRPAILRWLESQVTERAKWLSDQLAAAASGRRMAALA